MAYLDAASTEPLHPLARQALLAALDAGWADPARLYRDARRARLLLDGARESVAAVIGARPDEVSFPASGTAAVHLGLLGLAAGRARVGRRIVASAVEHSCVLNAAAGTGDPARVVRVGVERTGRIVPEAYAAALTADTAFAALQTANHEVGTVQPVAEVAAACAERGVPLLVDAAQSVGRLPVPDGWAVLTASAHKWGGPAGVGVLAVRRGARWRPPLPEDDRGRVPGFPDLPAIVAAAAALEAVSADRAEGPRLSGLVERIRSEVPRRVPDVEVVGDPVRRLPHLVTFSCLYADGEALVGALDRRGHAVSSGSSCTSSALEPSHVLAAMGVLTSGNLRVSLPRGTTAGDVAAFLDDVAEVVPALRAAAGAAGL